VVATPTPITRIGRPARGTFRGRAPLLSITRRQSCRGPCRPEAAGPCATGAARNMDETRSHPDLRTAAGQGSSTRFAPLARLSAVVPHISPTYAR
jgi:hypothetical protein